MITGFFVILTFFLILASNVNLAASKNIDKSSPAIILPSGYKTPMEEQYTPKLIKIRNNVQLNTLDINSSAKKTLIFVHGDAGSFDYWLPQINFFKDKYRIIAYDRSDCGRSIIKNYDPTYSNSAEDIALLVESLKIGPHVVIGHSRGQEIASVYFAGNPPGLKGFIAEGTGIAISPSSTTFTEAKQRIAENAIEKHNLQLDCYWELESFSVIISSGMGISQNDALNLLKFGCSRWRPSVGIMGGIDTNIATRLKTISIPMLQIDGANYRKNRDRRVTMQQYYKNGRLFLVEEAGHVPHLETFALFNQKVVEFLKEIGF